MNSDITLYALIKQLADKKIKIWLEDNALKFKAPKGALDAELKNQMVANKAALIDFLKEQAQSQASISPRPDPNTLPISNAQQRLWFIEQFSDLSDTQERTVKQGAYNIPIALRLKGVLNVDALEYAVNTLVARHEVLQTYFESKNGLPLQNKVSNARCHIESTDLSALNIYTADEALNDSYDDVELQCTHLIQKNISTPFDLSQWPLFKLDLIQKK